MDTADVYPDLLGDALSYSSQRMAQLVSLVTAAATVEARRKARRNAAKTIRSERELRELQDQERAANQLARAGWAPARDPRFLDQADLLQAARAWSAAAAYADADPEAADAVRRCEQRLRVLHPYAMAWYDQLRSDGATPLDAMREALPLFDRAPHARPGDPAAVSCSLAARVAWLIGPAVFFLSDPLGEHAEREVARGFCPGSARQRVQAVPHWLEVGLKFRLCRRCGRPDRLGGLVEQVVQRVVRTRETPGWDIRRMPCLGDGPGVRDTRFEGHFRARCDVVPSGTGCHLVRQHADEFLMPTAAKPGHRAGGCPANPGGHCPDHGERSDRLSERRHVRGVNVHGVDRSPVSREDVVGDAGGDGL